MNSSCFGLFSVAKWRLNVDRWLGVIRERPSFDVVDYKTRFARKLIDADPHHVGSVSFDKAVSGSSRSDICRYFLTTLLLCNDQLVAIDHDKPFSGDNDGMPFFFPFFLTTTHCFFKHLDVVYGSFALQPVDPP